MRVGVDHDEQFRCHAAITHGHRPRAIFSVQDGNELYDGALPFAPNSEQAQRKSVAIEHETNQRKLVAKHLSRYGRRHFCDGDDTASDPSGKSLSRTP